LPGSDQLVDRLEGIMREAGELAVTTSRGEYKRWTKGRDNSPVSDANIAVNDFLRERLSALVPEAGWLSEETEDHPPGRTQPSAWVVDPIDGTRAFLIGRPDWTVSLALVENGRPRLAALYAPVTDEMFVA
jgi:myo-inositol-1(or 4)-monophosphatase